MSPTERLHIALVSTEYPPAYGGGIGTCVSVLARALARRGHSVTVVTPGEADAEETGADGVRVRRAAFSTRATASEPARTLGAWWAWSERAAAVVREIGADVVELPDYRAEAAALVAQRGPGDGPAVVVRLHTPLAVLARFNAARARQRVLEAMEIEAILAADGVLSSSAALTREVRALVPELGEVEHARYGLDPDLLEAPSRPAAGADVVYVGRLEERKGVAVLARAAGAILAAAPSAVLHLVGGDTEWGPGEPSTRAVIERLIDPAVRSRVRFHGALPPDAVRERILDAAVCIFPSLFEAGPYTCLEAMALGRAAVGTDSGGMAEMIEDGVTGRLCRAGDAEGLARAVTDLLGSGPERLAAMGAAARERVRQRYSAAAAAAETEAAYRRVLERRAAGAAAASKGTALAETLASLSGEARAAGAERDRLAAGWDQQAARIAELDAQVARIWAELQTVAAERDRWHDEAQRLARAWEMLSAELRDASRHAARLNEDLLATQADRASLIDRVSRLERAVNEAQSRPVFKILTKAGLLRPIGAAARGTAASSGGAAS